MDLQSTTFSVIEVKHKKKTHCKCQQPSLIVIN